MLTNGTPWCKPKKEKRLRTIRNRLKINDLKSAPDRA